MKKKIISLLLMFTLLAILCLQAGAAPLQMDTSRLPGTARNAEEESARPDAPAPEDAPAEEEPAQPAPSQMPSAQDLMDAIRRPTSVTTLVQHDDLNVLDEEGVEALMESMAKYSPAEESLIVNNAPAFYYYDQLQPIEQEMYDIMLMIASDPVEENIGVMMTDMDPRSDEYYVSFCKAFYSMVFDHPELFWLYNSIEDDIYYSSDVIMNNGIYIVYFHLAETFENYEERMTAFNNAAQDFLADIDTSVSEYEIVRQVHDKLLDEVAYNHPVCDRQDYRDYAHTAYGALVADSLGNPKYPVCDGYTLAFEYLLQQCGIEAIYIGGSAGDDVYSMGGHAWSMAKIDNVWYEVDSTWNDSWNDMREYNDPEYDELLDDPVFHDRLEHYLFLISTEKITNYTADIEYFTYYYKDGTHYRWFEPASVHIRDTNANGDAEEGSCLYACNAVIDLAPVAMFDYIP